MGRLCPVTVRGSTAAPHGTIIGHQGPPELLHSAPGRRKHASPVPPITGLAWFSLRRGSLTLHPTGTSVNRSNELVKLGGDNSALSATNALPWYVHLKGLAMKEATSGLAHGTTQSCDESPRRTALAHRRRHGCTSCRPRCRVAGTRIASQPSRGAAARRDLLGVT
jgi:hypothetical protein